MNDGELEMLNYSKNFRDFVSIDGKDIFTEILSLGCYL